MKQYRNPIRSDWKKLTARASASYALLEPLAKEVFENVRLNGDTSLSAYTLKFDGVSLDSFQVSPRETAVAESRVPQSLKNAIEIARNNILTFHKAQKTTTVKVETQAGVYCWQKKTPIEKVGLYIPGGSAPLFSSVLMLATPANIAGCEEIVLCSPPDKNGNLPDVILYTAKRCGVTKIFKVGGMQAIAAMTFGTTTIPQVDKIFGPGNQYVTVAKQLATQYHVAIDMPAGPSELMVVADETADPSFIASDLLSQAEHGPDSQVLLITTSKAIAEETQKAVLLQLENLDRKDIAQKALDNSKIIVFNDDQTALDFANQYGAEHLIVCVKEEEEFIEGIKSAGSVFIGNYTPESAGDYASGTNHTLPTNGYAKQYSGVNLDSFLKQMTFQKISAKGIQNIGPAIELMAEAEGLQAHKNAVTLRLNDLEK